MLDWSLLQNILIISIACSTITVSFIQKTKKICHNSSCITWYSLFINLVLGFFFALTFTDLNDLKCIWVGLFGFIGADSIYRKLEGKISTYTELKGNKPVKNTSTSSNDDVIEEIKYD